ncbi:MAG: M48 family metalloprotease [Desulfobacterales bacterium]
MQRIYQKRHFWFGLIILAATWSSTAFSQNEADVFFDKEFKKQLESHVLDKELAIMPQLNQLNFGFGNLRGMEYFYEKTISKIFFQRKKLNATIIDVTIEESEITLELSHPILGTGTVNFSFSTNLLEQATDQEIQKILLESLGDENHQYVVIDPASRLYHLWSCNYFPDPSHETKMKLEAAQNQGYRPSAFCFKEMNFLPELMVEKAIAKEWAMRLRDYDFIGMNSEKQAHLSAVGEKILANWPVKVLGYDYAFYLAESPAINAFSLPAGEIIISTALFDSLDNDDELEALLVYAIAHIEQRYSLKKYYRCLAREQSTGAMKMLTSVAGVLAGPAGGGISGALSLAISNESCTPHSLFGYRQDYVKQADSMAALYFDIHKQERRALISLINKLQFGELTEKLHPDARLQHSVKHTDNDRIKRLENIKFKYVNRGNHFVSKPKRKPPMQLNLKYQQIFEKENKVHIYLDNRVFLQREKEKNRTTDIELSIKDKTGSHRFEHEMDLLTEDIWGAHLTFSASSRKEKNFLQDIEKIVLIIGSDGGPSAGRSEQPKKRYIFVPGTIQW